MEAGDAGVAGVAAEEFARREGAAVAEGGVGGVEAALGLDDEAGVDGAAGGVAAENQEIRSVEADALPAAAARGGKATVAADAEFGQGRVAVVVDFEPAVGEFGAAERFFEEIALEGAVGAIRKIMVGPVPGALARAGGGDALAVDRGQLGVAVGLGFGEAAFEIGDAGGGRRSGGADPVGFDDAAAFGLVGNERGKGGGGDFNGCAEIFHDKEPGRLRNGFFADGKAAARPEGGDGAGADRGLVVFGGEKDGSGGIGEGNLPVDRAQELFFARSGRRRRPESEALLAQEVEPGVERTRGDVATDEAVVGTALFDEAGAQVVERPGGYGFAETKIGKVSEKGLKELGGWIGVLGDFGAVGDAELEEGKVWETEDLGPVETVDAFRVVGAALEFVERGVLLLAKLVCELFSVALVEHDDGFLRNAAVDFAKTAAGGLQDHVRRAVALLGEDDAGKGPAVPSFLADLDEKDDADRRMGRVEGGEGEFGAFGRGELLVAAMVAEDGGGGVEAVLLAEADGEREDLPLQARDGAAVDGELGAGSGGVALVAEPGEELADAALDDGEGVGRVADDLDDGPLQERADAVHEGEIVDGVGDLGRLDLQSVGDANLLGGGQIGSSGKAEDGADGTVLGPFRDDAAELDVGRGGMVGLVDEDGKGGNLGDGSAKLVGGGGLFVVGAVEEHGLRRVVRESVEDDFLGIGDGDEAGELVERLKGGELLDVGVTDPVRAAGGGVGVQDHEAERAAEAGRKRLGDDPRGIERLDGAEARDDGGLESRWRENEEILRERGIVRLLQGEGEIEVDHRRHEKRLASAHREREEIIGVGDAVEEIAEHGGGVDRLRIVLKTRLEGGGENAATACNGLGGELQEGKGGGMGGEMFPNGLWNAEGVRVERVQKTARKDFVQGPVAAGDLEEEIGLDGIDLDRAQPAAPTHVVQLRTQGTLLCARPCDGNLLDEGMDHDEGNESSFGSVLVNLPESSRNTIAF